MERATCFAMGGQNLWLTGQNEVQNLTYRPVQDWLDVEYLGEIIQLKCTSVNFQRKFDTCRQ